MVTETKANPSVSTETSSDAVAENPSDDDESAILSDARQSEEGSGAAAEGTATDEDSGSSLEADPDLRREQLQARLDGTGEPLTSGEKEELRKLTQSHNDRQRAEKQAREAKQAEIAALRKGIADLPAKIAARLALDATGSAEHKLAIRDIQDEVQASLADMSTAVVHTIEANLRRTLKGVMPDSAHSGLDDSDLNQLLQASWDYQLELGKKSSDAAKKLARAQKDLDDANAEIQRLKGGRASGGAASSSGTGTGSVAITREAYQSASREQRQAWLKERPDEVNALLK